MKAIWLMAILVLLAMAGCKEVPQAGGDDSSSSFNDGDRDTSSEPEIDPGQSGQEKTPMDLTPGA